MARKKSIQKQLKKLNKTTLLFVVIFALIGVCAGFGTCYFLTRNDVFKINGETEITLSIGDTYEELGATAIAFGKDVSDMVEMDGTVDTSIEGRYVIKYTLDNFRFKNYTLYRLVVVEPLGE